MIRQPDHKDSWSLWRLWRAMTRAEEPIDPDRALVADAANLLQVGEFQLLKLAARDWMGRNLTEAESDRCFRGLIYRDEVPAWARAYAREVLRLHAEGLLDPARPEYHRFDPPEATGVPASWKSFLVMSGIVLAATVLLILALKTFWPMRI